MNLRNSMPAIAQSSKDTVQNTEQIMNQQKRVQSPPIEKPFDNLFTDKLGTNDSANQSAANVMSHITNRDREGDSNRFTDGINTKCNDTDHRKKMLSDVSGI